MILTQIVIKKTKRERDSDWSTAVSFHYREYRESRKLGRFSREWLEKVTMAEGTA